jgi:hypothetical protein
MFQQQTINNKRLKQSEKQNENDEKKSEVNFALPAHFRSDFFPTAPDIPPSE